MLSLRRFGLFALTVVLGGCGERLPRFMNMTLPSGKVVKVQSYLPENLFTGETALLLKFLPDASLEDAAALDAEVASMWNELKQIVQKQQPDSRLVLLRAVGSARGWTDGRQSQYVYRLSADGSWSMEKDPEVRLH